MLSLNETPHYSTWFYLWRMQGGAIQRGTSDRHKVAPHNVVPRGTAWCIICIFISICVCPIYWYMDPYSIYLIIILFICITTVLLLSLFHSWPFVNDLFTVVPHHSPILHKFHLFIPPPPIFSIIMLLQWGSEVLVAFPLFPQILAAKYIISLAPIKRHKID